jgi:hypothetical protein
MIHSDPERARLYICQKPVQYESRPPRTSNRDVNLQDYQAMLSTGMLQWERQFERQREESQQMNGNGRVREHRTIEHRLEA